MLVYVYFWTGYYFEIHSIGAIRINTQVCHFYCSDLHILYIQYRFKSLVVGQWYVFKKLVCLVSKDCINSDSKDIYSATKRGLIFSNLFFWTFYSSRILKKDSHFSPKYLSSFYRKYNEIFVEQANPSILRMISEGACDSEDCSNDAEDSALIAGINYILTYIQIENSSFTLW